MTPEEMQERVLYRDGLMLVIDKPAGLPVHRGPKGGTSLEDCFDALRFGLPRPPALAHRLDKETSGCLVLGRHRKALAHLGLLFKHGKIGKTYWAVVEGAPDAEEGVIDQPLGRRDATRGWWMKPDPAGQKAVTRWKVLGRGADAIDGVELGGPAYVDALRPPLRRKLEEGGPSTGVACEPPPSRPPGGQPTCPSTGEATSYSSTSKNGADPGKALTWLALEPLTGRTHQLRVHCAAMGWPIKGDAIYGNAPRFGGPGLHLHARAVVVPLGRNRAPVCVTAPVPRHMDERLRACGFQGDCPRRDEHDIGGGRPPAR